MGNIQKYLYYILYGYITSTEFRFKQYFAFLFPNVGLSPISISLSLRMSITLSLTSLVILCLPHWHTLCTHRNSSRSFSDSQQSLPGMQFLIYSSVPTFLSPDSLAAAPDPAKHSLQGKYLHSMLGLAETSLRSLKIYLFLT